MPHRLRPLVDAGLGLTLCPGSAEAAAGTPSWINDKLQLFRFVLARIGICPTLSKGADIVLNKTAVVCVFSDGQGAASGECLLRGRQAFEKAQNGNGQLLEKVGMDLGLAPLPLGFGATSVWDFVGRRQVNTAV